MSRKRFVIEMGMGVDQHGQEPTVAAARAVRNAIAHNALPGIWEVAGLSDPDQMLVEVQVAVPYPDQVREAEVLAVLPFGRKSLTVEAGGMVVQGRAIAKRWLVSSVYPQVVARAFCEHGGVGNGESGVGSMK